MSGPRFKPGDRVRFGVNVGTVTDTEAVVVDFDMSTGTLCVEASALEPAPTLEQVIQDHWGGAKAACSSTDRDFFVSGAALARAIRAAFPEADLP